MTASYLPLSAILESTSGISNAPGTQATEMSSGFTPWRSRPSSQPLSSLETMNSLNLAATMPIFMFSDTSLPS